MTAVPPIRTRRRPLLAAAVALLAACGGRDGAEEPAPERFEHRLERLEFFEWERGAPAVTALGDDDLGGVSPRLVDGRPVDAGLVALQHDDPRPSLTLREARRALPARPGVWQVAEYQAGGGARVHTAVGRLGDARPAEDATGGPAPTEGRATDDPPGDGRPDAAPAAADAGSPGPPRGPVRFELWARAADSAAPPTGGRLLAALELAPDDAERWRPLSADLPGRAGETWELLLVADDGSSGARAVGLWAAPVLVRRDVPRPPDLVLVTADTLRADHVGATRAALGLGPLPGLETPTLDALAAAGTHFVDALATCNSTSPSHATILTGLFPRDHGILDNRTRLDERATVVAELLRDRYLCVSNVTARHLNATVSGLGQGFDVAFEVPEAPGPLELPEAPTPFDALPERFEDPQVHREGRYVNARLEAFLAESGELPLFLWLHYFDPHTPYRVARAFRDLLPADEGQGEPLLEYLGARQAAAQGVDHALEDSRLAEMLLDRRPGLWFIGPRRSAETMRQLYAAGVSEFDARLGEALAALAHAGRETRVVFTADHGESLGERDLWFGHEGLYPNTLAVPLIVAGAGLPAGRRSTAPASTVDVFPTLLELAGIEAPPELPGRSLLALDDQADERRRRWFQHAQDSETGFREGPRQVVLTGATHQLGPIGEVHRGGRLELLVDGERRPVPDPEAERLRGEIEAWRAAAGPRLDAVEVELDAAARAELRALGYTGD